MLYWLLSPSFEILGMRVNLFRYITFRAAMAGVTAFLLCRIFGPAFIRWLRAKKVGERVEKAESERLAELHGSKAGTPTMGGGLILFGWFVSLALWGRWDIDYVVLGAATTMALGLIGAFDDYVKLTVDKKKGLSMRAKFALVGGISLLTGWLLYQSAHYAGRQEADLALYLPFVKGGRIPLGWLYLPWVAFLLMACTHSVNLTDGLDGLAAGCVTFVTFAFAAMAYVAGHKLFSRYLFLPNVPGAGELTVFCFALAGATLGFLWFNCHPAEIFMGDTGALALGGALGYAAAVIHQELLLAVAGGVFVAEAMSVILQVASFRTTGKRIFRIAPLHHHFQFGGWPETRVVVRFWIVAAVLALLSLAVLKLR